MILSFFIEKQYYICAVFFFAQEWCNVEKQFKIMHVFVYKCIFVLCLSR